MSSDFDLTMNLDDTLELDAVIQEWGSVGNVANVKTTKDYNIEGLQTNTVIFDPEESGTHKIEINGQILKINVRDTSNFDIIDSFEEGSNNVWHDGSNWLCEDTLSPRDSAFGSYTLRANSGGTLTVSKSSSNLPYSNLPEFGDIFRCDMWYDRSSSNGKVAPFANFDLDVRVNNGDIVLGGNRTSLSDGNPTGWMTVEIDMTDKSNVVARLLNNSSEGSVSADFSALTPTKGLSFRRGSDTESPGLSFDAPRLL